MDGINFGINPGTGVVASMSPPTVEPNSKQLKTAPTEPSEIEKLAMELRRSNEIHQNFRSEADRKIQELTQKNQLLLRTLTDAQAQNVQAAPAKSSSPVDELWNNFLQPNQQQQQTTQTSNEPVNAQDVQKIVQDTITRTNVASAEINANNAAIEQALVEKFMKEHPDLAQSRRAEVLTMWNSLAEANSSLVYNPQLRYEMTIQNVRKMFPKRDGASLGGDSTPSAVGGGMTTQRTKANTFESMAQTEQQAEAKRYQELSDYVANRKRTLGIRTGFPYDELEK